VKEDGKFGNESINILLENELHQNMLRLGRTKETSGCHTFTQET
jgi:hypothetical protein